MLKVQNLSVSFDGNNVFKDINFIINDKDKVGLIGRNGTGKSTLFKVLCGKIKEYEGEIVVPKGYKIGYLEQHLKFTKDNLVDEACLALPDYKRDAFWDAEKVLSELGFSEEDKSKNPMEFSGGWQVRLNLAKLLISEPDVLLLDEPTNYLDILSIRWLKNFLKNYKGALVLITHDRDFMDEIIDKTIILHRGSSIMITGNTQDMYEKISIDEETYEKTRVNEAKKRAQSQKYIDRFRYKASLASRVQSRIKMLEKQGVKEGLSDIQNLDFKFKYKDFVGNSSMFEAQNLKFGYDVNNILIDDLNFKIQKNDKVCVVGKNGKGKSTLLKLISEILKPIGGNVKINLKTEIGYFGQTNIMNLSPENTIEEELQSVDSLMPKSDILRIAGIMMFSGNLSQKKISVLSGGEKSRVLLGKILLQKCNLLILDEPTNHLDMESCEALAEALLVFEGASIIVSHNEYFLNNIANKLIVFDDDKIIFFDGNYSDFLKKIGWKNEEKEQKIIKENKNYKPATKKLKDNRKQKEKIENLIIDKEIKLEESVENGNYEFCGVLQKEIDDLMLELESL